VRALPNLVVRPGDRADADGIASVHVASWRAAYGDILPRSVLESDEFERGRHAGWRNWRFTPGERMVIATLAKSPESEPIVVAFCSYGPERDRGRATSGRGEVNAFYLDPRVWGTGVSDALMQHVEVRLRAEGFDAAVLWVLRDNPRARRFYERHGWATSGLEGNFEFRGAVAVEVEYRKELKD